MICIQIGCRFILSFQTQKMLYICCCCCWFQTNTPFLAKADSGRDKKDARYVDDDPELNKMAADSDSSASVTSLEGGDRLHHVHRGHPHHHHHVQGFIKDLMDLLAKDLHFDYEFHVSADYGSLDPISRNWTGIIGRLANKVSSLRSRCKSFGNPSVTFFMFSLQPLNTW